MPLYDIRGQLYENALYETLDYTTTHYKRNSVYHTDVDRQTRTCEDWGSPAG